MKRIFLFLALFIGYLTSQAQTVLTIEGQSIVNSDPNWQGYNVSHNVKTTLTFRNNAITSVNTSMYLLQAGDDYEATTINNLDGAVIYGNKLTWNGIQTGNIITHGLFVGFNINQTVKWNSLTNIPYNIIFKSGGTAKPNMNITSGGASYNIIKGGRFAGRCKGINGARFYNNTFYGDAGATLGLIMIAENSDGEPTYPGNPCINTKIKNNIFYTTTKTPSINIDVGSLAGFECDYNVYYCEAGDHMPVFSIDGVSHTWTEWKAHGYDAHSVVLNPNFNNTTDFIPTYRLDYGTNLGTEFNTGLSTTATWIVGITPATQIQNEIWQVGARIHAPSVVIVPPTVTTTPISSITTTTVTGGGNVTSDGGATVTERGVCWDQYGSPALDNIHTHDGTGIGTFTSNITGLSPNSTYYVRSYATNSAGTGYGNIVSFITSTQQAVSTYYISSTGNDSNSGLSTSSPWKTYNKINSTTFNAGDIILFKRGDTWRDLVSINPSSGSNSNYITIGAYGTGNKPLLLGSKQEISTSDWVNVGTNLWKNTDASFISYNVGNLIFNDEASYGIYKQTLAQVTSQGQFFFNTTTHELYLYSTSNPATYYVNIECALDKPIIALWSAQHYIIIENLDFRYSGGHGIGARTGCDNIIIKDCNMSFIGGASWEAGATRYGNGIEFWQSSSNITIERNTFSEIYDAAITPQFSGSGIANTSNWQVRDNIINKSEYSFEMFLGSASTGSVSNIYVQNNTMRNAGGGFGHNQRPDGVNGRHIIIWILNGTTSNFYIRNNIFDGATESALYLGPSVPNQITLDYNLYNVNTVAYVNNTYITLSSWSSYSGDDIHSVSGNPGFISSTDSHLSSTSIAVGKGLNVGLIADFDNVLWKNPPSMGAFEYDKVPSPFRQIIVSKGFKIKMGINNVTTDIQ